MEVLQSDASAALFGERQDVSRSLDEILDIATERTIETLVKARVLTDAQADQFATYLKQSDIGVADLLPKMAELQGVEEDSRAGAVEEWTRKMTFALKKRFPLIPFAGGMPNPTAFCDRYPELFEIAKSLKVPILFAEDSDVVGLGVINPALADVITEEFVQAIFKKDIVRPFVSVVLLDFKTWTLMCRRLFGDDRV